MRLLPRSEPQPDFLDRLVKVPIYAHQRIPEVWIVDIAGGVVHVHAEPVDGPTGADRRVRVSARTSARPPPQETP